MLPQSPWPIDFGDLADLVDTIAQRSFSELAALLAYANEASPASSDDESLLESSPSSEEVERPPVCGP
jgi:hypothetical protein